MSDLYYCLKEWTGIAMRRVVRHMGGNIKIKSRIILLYITVLILSFIITFGIFKVLNERHMEREIGNAGLQTVNALKGNLDFIFDNVKQFSDFIYFDKQVQDSLKNVDSRNINPVIQQTIQKSLVNMMLSGSYMSSVFIFDKYNNYYYSYKVGPILVNKDRIDKTDWYRKLMTSGGDEIFIHKSEDVLSFPARTGKNYITLIREVCDEVTYEHLAVLLITIDEETIRSYFKEVSEAYDSQYCIVNSDREYIVRPQRYEEELKEYLNEEEGKAGYKTIHLDHSKMIMVYQDLGISDWRLYGFFETKEANAMKPYYTSVIILIICLNLVFVFLCAIALARLIFNPLSRLEKHMKLVEDGQFVEMPVEEGQNEINGLKRVFNQMIVSIRQLIMQVKQEEQVIAKNELDIIQAQINPHFLYNTLDAISALALMKDHEHCFLMTQALGNFYRNSLNSGMDLVTVRDELACIDSYITILNIRYDNKIIVHYDVEKQIGEMKVLKLILQPVIENSVHHGIKNNREEGGNITIKGYQDDDEIIFIITDDGCGMEQERIEQIIRGDTKTGKSGFGLYSLIQRISLYYDIDHPVTINSEIGSGTEITIRLKVLSGEVSD